MFNQRAFLGQVPIVGMGQAYPVNYPDPYEIYNRLKAQYREAIETGDEEMARFYQYQAEEMFEDYYIPGASREDFSRTPPPPPRRSYTTPRRPRTDFSAPLPPPTPTPSRPRNIPQGAYNPTPTQSMRPMTPTQQNTIRFSEQGMAPCPPGQFINPNYPERGCQPLGRGGIPTLPGGFSTSDVSTSTFSAPSSPVWTMGGARRPIQVMNLG